MSDRLPYEEQLANQLTDLPLPDENMAWADMKRRLDKDDNDSFIPFWLRGCGLWGLLFVALSGIGWWLIWQEKHENRNEEKQKTQHVSNEQPGINKNRDITNDSIQIVNSTPDERSNRSKNLTGKKNYTDTILATRLSEKNKVIIKEGNKIPTIASNGRIKKTSKALSYSKKKILETKNKKNAAKVKMVIIDKSDISNTTDQGMKKISDNDEHLLKKNEPAVIIIDSAASLSVNKNNIDTANKLLKDSVIKKINEPPVKDTVAKKDSSKPKSISFSAGIAMHQLLPVNGQKFTPYNLLGRKGSLADYIPSLFFRMYKNNKWFLQSEFRYGAPQYTRDIIYRQTVVPDSFSNSNIITSTKLKKTFYHQLPVGFNYFLLPNWSLGTGIVWNRFNSVVYEQEVIKRNNITAQDSGISKSILQEKPNFDSASVFSKSYIQSVIETQYKWKQFSLGAKYLFGLQPFIKFSLDGNRVQQEKSSSLQIFFRYEIWKSRPKR